MISMVNCLPACPTCKCRLYNLDDKKDMKWIPNGHKYKMGNDIVEAVDPVVIRGICVHCHTVVDFEELIKERVEFT